MVNGEEDEEGEEKEQSHFCPSRRRSVHPAEALGGAEDLGEKESDSPSD